MMGIYEFGRKLLETNDLDPVYVLLWNAGFSPNDLQRWLLAYWCFYHVGTASWITEGGGEEAYWGRMFVAARSKSYPRSAERRHFRGANAEKSVTWLSSKGVAAIFAPLSKPATVAEVMRYVGTWVGFGPWISFKVADMLERLNLVSIDFSDTGSWLYDSPRESAAILNTLEGEGEYDPPHDKGVGDWAIGRILSELEGMKAPPRYERLLNSQEAETILCKWKSYRNGHYHVGEDIASCRKGLLRFARCRLSQSLLQAGKRGRLW